MRDSDFTTIYNVPESISGLGCGSYFIGICLFVALGLCGIPCLLVDETWLKDSIELIFESGIMVTLGMAFVFIICPIYFLIGFVKELYRHKKYKSIFYSTPNIEYIKLNDDEIFVKNTCKNHDFSIKKRDIVNVFLYGDVKSFYYLKATRTPASGSYIENLTLIIKTKNENYTIYPQIKSKSLIKKYKYLDDFILLKAQISFYKKYFNRISINFNYNKADTLSMIKVSELEN